MALQLNLLGFSIGDQPFSDVKVQPQLSIKRTDNNQVIKPEDIVDESEYKPGGDQQYYLKPRWYRSTGYSKPTCSIYTDRLATIQCVCCEKWGVPQYKSFFSSVDVYLQNWKNHYNLLQEYKKKNGLQVNGKAKPKPETGWLEVSQEREYIPTEFDIGFTLKFEAQIIDAKTQKQEGQIVTLISKAVSLLPQPRIRKFVSLLPSGQTSTPDSFSVLTYNVLAPYLAQTDYSAVPAEYRPAYFIDFEYRRQLIVREIAAYIPDILCLQEVQTNHWETFWQPALAELGYDGLYKSKSGSGVYGQDGHMNDGCAILYKTSKYSLFKQYALEYDQAATSLANKHPDKKQQILQRLTKNNVALFAVLNCGKRDENDSDARQERQNFVCIANTHIHANPDNNDVKVFQTSTFLTGVERITHTPMPIVIAGDFNSLPLSAPYKLITKGSVPAADSVHKTDSSGILKLQKLTHPLPLASVWHSIKGNQSQLLESEDFAKLRQRMDRSTNEPAFTIHRQDFSGTLDYIFYGTNLLEPISLLQMPSPTDIVGTNGLKSLPNTEHPSDHVPIMATFRIHQQPQDTRNGTINSGNYAYSNSGQTSRYHR